MRKKNQKQMPLMPADIEHPRAKELDRISKILDAIPTISYMVLQDLVHDVKNRQYGAQGMTAEQVLRALLSSRPKASVMKNWPFISLIPLRIGTSAVSASPIRVSRNPLFAKISRPYP